MAERSVEKQRELRRVKNVVRGALNRPKAPYLEQHGRWGRTKLSTPDLILGGFSQLGPTDAEQFLEWLKGFPGKAVQVYPVKPIRKARELTLQTVTIPLPLIARVNWLSTLLEISKDRLATFADNVIRYERAYLMGEYPEAQQVLDEIRAEFGYSVWDIENQITLLQRWKGLDAQKEYARTIGKNARGCLAGVAAYWVSQRNEESTVFNRFRARLERRIEEWDVGEPLKDAYAIVLGISSFGDLSDARASSALGALASSSLIDAYTAVVGVLESMVAAPSWQTNQLALGVMVARLPHSDMRIRNLSAFLSADFTTLPLADTAIIDRMSGAAIQSAETNGIPDAASLYDCALAEAAGEDVRQLAWPAGSPLADVYALVATTTLRVDGFETSIDQGRKLLTNIKHLPISLAVRGLIAAQDPEYVLGSASPAIEFFIASRTLHPWHSMVLPREVAKEICIKLFRASTSAQLIERALSGMLQPQDARCVALKEFAARSIMPGGQASRALEFMGEQDVNSEAFARRRLAPLRVVALLSLGHLNEALSTTASVCASDPGIALLLPLQDLVDEARSTKVQDPLSLAITYDLYLERNDDADVFQPLQFAYEDFVLMRGVQRPSELVVNYDPSDKNKLIYFLHQIAVPEVMDVSFWLFKTSRDTFAERISVCSGLIGLDPANEAVYRDEIKDLTRLMSIQDGLEDVDRSRVFINLPKLQRWAEIELRESFDRYKALLRAGVQLDTPGDFDKILKDFASGKANLDRFSQYPEDEPGQLLLDIFKAIAEKYLHDPDFGLDAYLSMRIRHGSLAGHIRGPLEELGLLAVRDQGTDQYRMLRKPAVEDHWVNAADWTAVRERVEAFSRDFDAQIDALVRSRLQIYGTNKPDGLFTFDPGPLIIYYLRANLDEGSSFVDFLNRVFDALDVYLSISLANVSKYIQGTFKDAIDHSLEQFRGSVEDNVNPHLRAELRQLIGKASPELQASIDRVASWFALDPENERRTLRTMEQIVEIAIQATNNAHRGIVPAYTLKIEDLGLQSNETFLIFTDILFTILDNIYTHSGLDAKPIIGIHITKEAVNNDGGTRVRILVTNQVAPHKKTLANERRLERIREQIQAGDYRALSKVEGGTGLLKLKRIVAADSRQTLDFGYRAEVCEFFVDITMVLIFEPARLAA